MIKRTRRRWGAPWKLAELKRLGRAPDSVLARRMGRTIKEVVAMRESRRLGLVTGPRRWTAREIRLLGSMPDREVAEVKYPRGQKQPLIAGALALEHTFSGLANQGERSQNKEDALGPVPRPRGLGFYLERAPASRRGLPQRFSQ